MIDIAFNLLANQLNAYIDSLKPNPTEPEVVLANIATVDSGNDNSAEPTNRIILSLVNIEEEATLKNRGPYTRINQQVSYLNPPVFLNLYMLVTAYYSSYNNALIRLSDTIRFFQSKNNFSFTNSPMEGVNENEGTIELYLDLFSMTFEQLNHLWGSLGGKQWPSALYKVRLVRITENRINEFGTVIEQIKKREAVITPEH